MLFPSFCVSSLPSRIPFLLPDIQRLEFPLPIRNSLRSCTPENAWISPSLWKDSLDTYISFLWLLDKCGDLNQQDIYPQRVLEAGYPNPMSLGSSRCQQNCAPSRSSRAERVSLPFPASRAAFLVFCGSWLLPPSSKPALQHLQISISSHIPFSSLWSFPPPLSCGNIRDCIEDLQIIQDNPPIWRCLV